MIQSWPEKIATPPHRQRAAKPGCRLLVMVAEIELTQSPYPNPSATTHASRPVWWQMHFRGAPPAFNAWQWLLLQCSSALSQAVADLEATRNAENMQQKILTVAVNPAVDLSTRVERMLANRKLRCAGAHVEPGGGGINVSRVIRGFGGKSTAFVALGGPTG